MMLYLDASALVKRYIEEEGSDVMLEAMDRPGAWSMCRVGFVETARAIALGGDGRVLKRFEDDWAGFYVVEVDRVLSERAAKLALLHRLRSLDAFHLAAALSLPEGTLTFATWDARLHDAAMQQDLVTLPASLD